MFAESILETSWAQRTRQSWTTFNFVRTASDSSRWAACAAAAENGWAAGRPGSSDAGNFGSSATRFAPRPSPERHSNRSK
jgi:hypothetical protein